ncbi:MAG: hypothetical protein IKY31_05735, partial [Bacteroidaceae bacterium]|nr:hypothetical protein [Bacteroidaceae bacterium]
PEGYLIGRHKVYINPAHFLALPPDDDFTQVESIRPPLDAGDIYDLRGIRLSQPPVGRPYIQGGKKKIFRQ